MTPNWKSPPSQISATEKTKQIQGYTETETPPRKASKHILTLTDKEPKKHLMDWTFKPCRASDTNRLSTRQPTVAWEREREAAEVKRTGHSLMLPQHKSVCMRPCVISERLFCVTRALKILPQESETSRSLFKWASLYFSWPQKDLFHLRSRSVTQNLGVGDSQPFQKSLCKTAKTNDRSLHIKQTHKTPKEEVRSETEFKEKWKRPKPLWISDV